MMDTPTLCGANDLTAMIMVSVLLIDDYLDCFAATSTTNSLTVLYHVHLWYASSLNYTPYINITNGLIKLM